MTLEKLTWWTGETAGKIISEMSDNPSVRPRFSTCTVFCMWWIAISADSFDVLMSLLVCICNLYLLTRMCNELLPMPINVDFTESYLFTKRMPYILIISSVIAQSDCRFVCFESLLLLHSGDCCAIAARWKMSSDDGIVYFLWLRSKKLLLKVLVCEFRLQNFQFHVTQEHRTAVVNKSRDVLFSCIVNSCWNTDRLEIGGATAGCVDVLLKSDVRASCDPCAGVHDKMYMSCCILEAVFEMPTAVSSQLHRSNKWHWIHRIWSAANPDAKLSS
jgi:hypothetical protein